MPKGNGAEGLPYGNRNFQLLLKLPFQATGKVLLLSTLPTGELPPEGEGASGLPLSQKEPPLSGGYSSRGNPSTQRKSTVWRKK
jgi:hypothetical protein